MVLKILTMTGEILLLIANFSELLIPSYLFIVILQHRLKKIVILCLKYILKN